MTLAEKLRTIRRDGGWTQEALGAQGFVSAPGWIKIENGQRSPSEELLETLVGWLVEGRYVRASAAKGLKEELLVLKYLGSKSPFVQELARAHARSIGKADTLLAASSPANKPKRGRPKTTK